MKTFQDIKPREKEWNNRYLFATAILFASLLLALIQ